MKIESVVEVEVAVGCSDASGLRLVREGDKTLRLVRQVRTVILVVKRFGNCACGYHGFLPRNRKCPHCGKEITEFHTIKDKHPSHYRDPTIEVRFGH